MGRRILASAVAAFSTVCAQVADSGVALAAIPGASGDQVTRPWMVLGGLATVPVALYFLAIVLRSRPDDDDRQDETGGHLSTHGAAASNCDAKRTNKSSRP